MKLPEAPTVDWSPGYEWEDVDPDNSVACDAAAIVSSFTVDDWVAADIRAAGGEPTVATLEIATDRKPYGSGGSLVGIELTTSDIDRLVAALTQVQAEANRD